MWCGLAVDGGLDCHWIIWIGVDFYAIKKLSKWKSDTVRCTISYHRAYRIGHQIFKQLKKTYGSIFRRAIIPTRTSQTLVRRSQIDRTSLTRYDMSVSNIFYMKRYARIYLIGTLGLRRLCYVIPS